MMSASGESVSSVGGKDGSNFSSSSESSVRSNSFGKKTFFGGAIGPTYTLPKPPRYQPSPSDDVVRSCYLRKLEGRKKFFVLRRSTVAKPARLEYYEAEKKFAKGKPPKKTIALKDCFDISQTDSKRMFAIALHTINDCVRIAMSSEGDMNHWLRDLHALAEEEGQDLSQSTEKPQFEHMWCVTAVKKGLGKKENIVGPYRLGLTSNEVTLLKVGESNGRNGIIKFPLNAIRGVSHDAMFGSHFNVDLGRRVTIGPGLLSFKTDANKIAQKMHLVFLEKMRNLSSDDEPLPENWRSIKGRDYVPTSLFINGNEDYYYMNHSPPIQTPEPEEFIPPTVKEDEYFPMNFGRVQDVHFIPSSSSEPQSGTSSNESSFRLEKISSYFTDQLIDMPYVRRYSAGSRSGSASSSSSSTYATQTMPHKRRKKD